MPSSRVDCIIGFFYFKACPVLQVDCLRRVVAWIGGGVISTSLSSSSSATSVSLLFLLCFFFLPSVTPVLLLVFVVHKDMKVAVELGDEIDAKKACERQLRQKYKSLGALKIVTDRGLQVGNLAVIDISATTIIPPTLINLITLSWMFVILHLFFFLLCYIYIYRDGAEAEPMRQVVVTIILFLSAKL
ncbi:uncharacterized protein LOC103853449 [Brassica rapa]|uniref:uncharacterized protein LOC103853449 n=1 Tax=Brassica campestris TaxID=3711 RepID=UPI00142E262D|nr:uncharacterized protein LOC103853449 [Brassica rapa]